MLHTLRIYHPSLSEIEREKKWKILSRNPYDLLCCSTYCISYFYFIFGRTFSCFQYQKRIKSHPYLFYTFFLNIAIDRTGLKVYIISIITPYNCQNIYPQEVVVEEEENEIRRVEKC